ncbi:hypothetical protein HRbin15_00961 [bacterium HR15]|nr:hypothetical protein HRbin15_00961 [bacterium HR15]
MKNRVVRAVGLGIIGWIVMLTAWTQTLNCGDRVGVTYAGDGVNVRSTACGSVIGTIRAGNEGQIASSSCWQDCSIGGTTYRFWRVNPHGWIAQGSGSTRWLVPMPGEGYYPNVTANLGAYPVRVYDDVGSAGLRVRLGPSTNYPEVANPRFAGATGTAYAVRIGNNLVWWRIRWSNGDIGWSADSQIPYGVYLIKTGAPSGYTVVQLRLEASGSGGSVGIRVDTPDLDAVVPANFTVSTPTTLRYVSGDRLRLTAPPTAPNGAPFQRWLRNGSFYSSSQYIEFNITANDTFTAVYGVPTNTITIQSSNPSSGVSITVSPPDNSGQGSGTTPFTRTYNQGTSVSLTAPATAPNGNRFQKWQRNGVDFSTSQTISFTVNANDTFTAVYGVPTNTITIQSSNPSSGVSITVSPPDNSGQGSGTTPFTRTYNQGTSVSLTAPATAPNGNRFQKWQRNGVDFSTSQTISFTVNANDTFTAVYTITTQGGNQPDRVREFLLNLAAPWQQGQLWQPSTYDDHPRGGRDYAVDFNLVNGAQAECRYHTGLPNDCNEVVLASHDGKIITGSKCETNGNYIYLVASWIARKLDGTEVYLGTIYLHLSGFLGSNGDQVSRGQPIAKVGASGDVTGPHLHFQVGEFTKRGSTITFTRPYQIINPPDDKPVRLSGQIVSIDYGCRDARGYLGPPLRGTPMVGEPGQFRSGECPANCGDGLTPPGEDGRCLYSPEDLIIYLSDVNGDGCVDDQDLLRVLQALGTSDDAAADIDWNGIVDDEDLLAVLADFGHGCESE